jgi:hypothetical protein
VFRDRSYELVRGSDVERDGFALELWDVTGGADDQVLEAFYSDSDGSMTFSAYREDLALDVVEWFTRKARELLPRIEEDNEPGSSRQPTA